MIHRLFQLIKSPENFSSEEKDIHKLLEIAHAELVSKAGPTREFDEEANSYLKLSFGFLKINTQVGCHRCGLSSELTEKLAQIIQSKFPLKVEEINFEAYMVIKKLIAKNNPQDKETIFITRISEEIFDSGSTITTKRIPANQYQIPAYANYEGYKENSHIYIQNIYNLDDELAVSTEDQVPDEYFQRMSQNNMSEMHIKSITLKVSKQEFAIYRMQNELAKPVKKNTRLSPQRWQDDGMEEIELQLTRSKLGK